MGVNDLSADNLKQFRNFFDEFPERKDLGEGERQRQREEFQEKKWICEREDKGGKRGAYSTTMDGSPQYVARLQ
jgi:oligoendopeptidase F